MSRGRARGLAAAVLLTSACGRGADVGGRAAGPADPSPTRRDAEALGREVFELVDRAVDYRGSHRGRPARSLPQLGIDSLTPMTVRRLMMVDREPVVTVAFRRREGRELTACRGDSQILEEAALNSGRFTLMCTTSSGSQQSVQVIPSAAE